MFYSVWKIIHSVASTVAMIAAVVIGIEIDPTIGVGVAAATAASIRR